MSRRKYRYKDRAEYEAELRKVELQVLVAGWVAGHRLEKKAPDFKVKRGHYTVEVWEGQAYYYGQFTYRNDTNERPTVQFVEYESWSQTWREHYKHCPVRATDKDAVAVYELWQEADRLFYEHLRRPRD